MVSKEVKKIIWMERQSESTLFGLITVNYITQLITRKERLDWPDLMWHKNGLKSFERTMPNSMQQHKEILVE